MSMNNILDKLPQNLQNLLNNPLKDAKEWSEEWNVWFHQCIHELNIARDNNIITKDEWLFLDEVYFKKGASLRDDTFFKFYIGVFAK